MYRDGQIYLDNTPLKVKYSLNYSKRLFFYSY